MSRIRWTAFSVVLAAMVMAASAMAGQSARAARTCPAPKYPGAGYFTTMSVKNVSCATGKKVVLAHYRCRVKHGRAGRCASKVQGYSCKETRMSIPTEIDGRVICRRGTRNVTYTYQQDL